MPQATGISANSLPAQRVDDSCRQIGAWQLMRLIGEGQFSRVYAARPASHPAERPAGYALKLLADQWSGEPAAIELIRREAIVGKKVSDPHLISVLSAHVGAPPYFLVMPLLEGTTLERRLAGGERPGVAVAVWIARQTAHALQALHLAGWMHTDVKPSNIFLSEEGHVTLLDLGFARRPADSTSLVHQCLTGTMQYIAPEMITSTFRPDIRSDIYSLGATLYETLGGRPPFVAHSLEQLADKQRQGEPPPIRLLAPRVPVKLARFVHQMLAKEPLRRPQTPQELINRLVEFEIELFDMR
ncbi:MAG TPA: serine/threonine-protein kinase [Pirellulales bacterium]|nr:serine/threonine-protein kinase [Pirellulales bacterium]